MFASCFLLLLHVCLPFYNVAIRPHALIPVQNHAVLKQSVGQHQVNDGCTIAFIPWAVLSGSVIICTYQTVLIQNIVTVHCVPPFCAHWVPVWTVGVDVSCKHCAASPLPDDFLPDHSPPWSLSGLSCSLFVMFYNRSDFRTSPCILDDNYGVPCILP